VVDRHGYFIGLVERERAEQIPEDRQPVFTVREIMRPDEKGWRVRLDDPLQALLARRPLRRIGPLIAVDSDGPLRGGVCGLPPGLFCVSRFWNRGGYHGP